MVVSSHDLDMDRLIVTGENPALITVGATAVDLLTANDARRAFTIVNEGAGTIRVTLGATTPTATLGHLMRPGDAWDVSGFSGRVQAIRTGAVDASVQVTGALD